MNLSSHHKLIIVGCGASGMAAAVSASLYCDDILVLERNDVPGKKIPATGNGKCNLTNLNIAPEDFRGTDSDTAYKIYRRFDNNDTIAFFKGIGVPVYDRNGYCYPRSGQASSVRDALSERLYELGVNVEYGVRVRKIRKENNLFILNCTDSEYTCDKLILAAGGQAQACFGTDGSMYYLAEKLGHSTIKVTPALVGLTTDFSFLKELAGVRHEALISISDYSEFGEIIFSKNGISGIPVMNASRYALNGQSGNAGGNSLLIDFYPDFEPTVLKKLLLHTFRKRRTSLIKSLVGVLNAKLIEVILRMNGINPDYSECDSYAEDAFDKIVFTIKNFRINITGSAGFENAQVTAGGIPLKEIDSDTMESLICPGLYFAGELLDVDGKCGGYNLQWAWSSGFIAGAFAGGGKFDKNKLIGITD